MPSGKAFAVLFAGATCAIAACGPPGPPGHDIQLHVNGPIVWAQNVALDDYAWENLPTVNTSVEANTVGVDFRDPQEQTEFTFPINPTCIPQPGNFCPPFVFRRRPELHLFARSPRQVYFGLTTNPFFEVWPANLAAPANAGITAKPYELPADVVVPYFNVSDPFAASWPNYVSIASFSEQDFIVAQNGQPTSLSDWTQPTGSGTPPAPLRRIDLVDARVVTLPECSASVNVQSTIFSNIQSQVSGALTCQHVSLFLPAPILPPIGVVGDLSPRLDFLTATTYLTHQDPTLTSYPPDLIAAQTAPVPPWQGVIGGIIVQGQISTHLDVSYNTTGFDLEDCSTTFIYDERYTIGDDGVFTVLPLRIQLSSTNGTMCNGAGDVLPHSGALEGEVQTLFETTLPQQAHDLAQSLQVINLGLRSTTSVTGDHSWHCSYPPKPNESLIHDKDAVNSGCVGAANELAKTIVPAGADKLGIGDRTALNTAIMDDANWSCESPPPDQLRAECSQSVALQGNCAFHLRADSLIAEPDEVRIGWRDFSDINSQESSGSSVAFVASFFKDNTSFTQLCSPQLTPGISVTSARPYYERYFATLNVPGQNCAPPTPPGPPPPILVCGCSDDSDCFAGDKCSEINRVSSVARFVLATRIAMRVASLCA